MAESTIQRRVSDPEFTTQTVAATVKLGRSGGSITATLSSATNVSSVSFTTVSGYSYKLSTLTFNVAKSGYTLVGITTVPATQASTSDSSSVAYISTPSSTPPTPTDDKHASLTVSGNTIIATLSSGVTIGTSGYMAHLQSITCKYVKNN